MNIKRVIYRRGESKNSPYVDFPVHISQYTVVRSRGDTLHLNSWQI